MLGILFLFDAATGFTFFQFIYSERIVVLILSLFCFYYTRSFQQHRTSDKYLCLLTALVGLFFKDTGFLLFTTPAFTVLVGGSIGLIASRPRLHRHSIQEWLRAYDLELCLCGLIVVLAACFFYLSYLPSLYAGVNAYDSHLRWSRFEPDLRLAVLALTVVVRSVQVFRGKLAFSALDAFNVGGMTYALGLFAMVGFRSSNYMALPVQFASTLNLVVLATWLIGWLQTRGINTRTLGIGTVVACGGLIGIEHLERRDFVHRINKMQIAQDSWVKTLDKMDQISQQALIAGEEINIIYSKSWFRNRGHLERLKFNRLIYYDLDLQTYTVMDGTGKGTSYQPKSGDFLLNIDTGRRLSKLGFDMSPYKDLGLQRQRATERSIEGSSKCWRVKCKTFLLGVGAQKAGTSWLHDQLNRRHDADFGFLKEYHIFDALELEHFSSFRPRTPHCSSAYLAAGTNDSTP